MSPQLFSGASKVLQEASQRGSHPGSGAGPTVIVEVKSTDGHQQPL